MRHACGFRFAAALALIAVRLDADEVPSFDTWTVREGLPQGSVYDILQTRDGYLWLATLGGLVRFDGARFTVFERANAPGIASNRFVTLFEDRGGVLWAGTEDSGLTRFAGGRFRTYRKNDGLPSDRIRAIDQDQNGAILALTEGGLARMNGERFERVSLAAAMPLNPDAIPGTMVHSGLSLRDAGGLHTLFGGRHHKFDAETVGVIDSRYRDQHGVLWGRRSDGSLLRFRDAAVERHVPPHPLPAFTKRVIAMHEDRSGDLWLSIEGEGVLQASREGIERYTTDDGLAGNTVVAFFEDREGNLWMGSVLGGLSRFRRRTVTTISTADGLPSDNIYPLAKGRDGVIYVGTWGAGVTRLVAGRVDRAWRKLPGEYISALTERRDGTLWVGTSGSGLYRIEGDRVTGAGVPATFIFALHEDRQRTLWIGTDKGLLAMTAVGIRRYGDAHVHGILEETGGALWLATLSGLVRFDGRFFETIEGLSSNHVRALHRDDDGVLWAGTYDGGLNLVANGKVTVIQKRHGLFDNGVFAIVDDRRGNFWMTSNRGIFRTRKRELEDFAAGRIRAVHSVGYGTEDGMLSPECNGGSQPAALRTADGLIWFPTQGGIASIDPARVVINNVPPPVIIENFSKTGARRFRIQYTALSFVKPEQVRFRYRLEGLENEWTEAGSSRSAQYAHVPSGRYTFRVLAANSDGVWNERGASIDVHLPPPVWETKWFLAVVAAAFLLSLTLFHRWRVRRVLRAQEVEASFVRRLMLSEEAERTRIASELHDSLGQSLMVIANHAIMATRDAERGQPLDDHLTQISETTLQAAEDVREIAHNLHPQHLERLGLTRALRSMVERARASAAMDITDDIDSIDRLFPPELELSFYRLVQEALTNALRHAEATRISIEIRREDRRVRVVVRDDGRGFEMPAADAPGLGLASLRQRATMLGGALRIESRPGAGTVVAAEIPFDV